MRLLIYGAGVIGSLYAALFAEAGYDTTVYARGRRLEALRAKGLMYVSKGVARRADMRVTDRLEDDDVYDFIFLTVRAEQAGEALRQLSAVRGACIVTMVNCAGDYAAWEDICGAGRLLPAFPGAGGGIRDDVLEAALTPGIIQPTVFGEISGRHTPRCELLARVFRGAGIPCREVRDMRLWQLCHLALVVPLADAYYDAADPARAGREPEVMRRAARRLKRNFRLVKAREGALLPGRLNIFIIMPLPLISAALGMVYNSRFGERFMYRHAVKAPDEMALLRERLYERIGE